MKESSRIDHQAPRTETPRAAARGENGTDATRGEPLALRAQKRNAELEPTSVDALLNGDLAHASGQATKDIDMATGTGDQADGIPEAAREHRALAWAAAASLAVMFWLVRPIALGILVGTLLAFLAQPACKRLAARIGAPWAVLTTVIVSGFAVAVTLGGLGWLFVSRGTVLATRLVAAVGPLGFVDSVLTRAGGLTARFGVSSDQLRDHVRGLAIDAASSAERIAAAIASTTASALLGLLFAMLQLYAAETRARRHLDA